MAFGPVAASLLTMGVVGYVIGLHPIYVWVAYLIKTIKSGVLDNFFLACLCPLKVVSYFANFDFADL